MSLFWKLLSSNSKISVWHLRRPLVFLLSNKFQKKYKFSSETIYGIILHFVTSNWDVPLLNCHQEIVSIVISYYHDLIISILTFTCWFTSALIHDCINIYLDCSKYLHICSATVLVESTLTRTKKICSWVSSLAKTQESAYKTMDLL